MSYIFWANDSNVLNVHRMFRCQTNVYVTTFMSILLIQSYCKHDIRVQLEKSISILRQTQKNTMLIKKVFNMFSASATHTSILI